MRRLSIAVLAALLVLAIAAPTAAKKAEKVTDRFTDGVDIELPPGEVCDFAVGLKESVKVADTRWLDDEGEVIRGHLTVNGTTEWSGPGGSAVEHWSWSGWFDAETKTVRQSGNIWNLHQKGLILHDKGLLVFNDETGELIKMAGPHEVFEHGLDALCDAIG